MIYTANITTPKDTAQTALKKTVLKVTKGLVYKVELYFPPGSVGLMGVAVFDGSTQRWPSSSGEFFIGNDKTFYLNDMYLMDSEPYEFQVHTYNTDDTHNHLVNVRISLLGSEDYQARFLPKKSYDYLVRQLARLSEERTAAAAGQRKSIEKSLGDNLSGITKTLENISKYLTALYDLLLRHEGES